MKILILLRNTVFTSRGGAEVQADFIREACVKAGHEVHFVFDSNTEVQVNDDGAIYHRLPDHGRNRSWKNIFAIRRLFEQICPDLVYQRVRFSYTGIAAYWSRSLGIRFVHNISADYACKKNRIKLGRMFLSNIITEYAGRYGIRNADLLVAQTSIQADMLKQNFQLDCQVIPNGHPVPAAPFEKDVSPLVVWVANVKPWKQPEVFLELANRMSDTDARFVMVGKPSGEDYHREFLAQVAMLDNLEYLGQLSIDEVNSLLASAAVFVNTSQPREGFPNTFIQAWLRETPVAALSFDPDNINTGNDIGFLSGTVDNLEHDLRVLVTSPDRVADMGRRAREYAISHFDCEVTGRQYLDAFEQLVSPSS